MSYETAFLDRKGHQLALMGNWQFFFGIWGILWGVGPTSSGFSAATEIGSRRGISILVL